MSGTPTEFGRGDLAIRAYREEDAEALREAVVDSYEHLRPWMPWAKENQTIQESAEVCARARRNFEEKTDFMLSIWLDGRFAGSTGFHLRWGPIEDGAAEIGMWIRTDQSGRGLGSRALRAMLEWGLTEWGWERLVWKTDPKNLASRRVAENCGLLLEASPLGEACVYAIERADWAAPS